MGSLLGPDRIIVTPFPSLNEMVGGGLARGTITEVFGESGSGKSVFCANLVGGLQKDHSVGWVDCDSGFCPRYMGNVLDLSNLLYYRPGKGSSLDYIKSILPYLDVLVIDPINGLWSPSDDLAEDNDFLDTMKWFIPAMNRAVAESQCAVLVTSHIRFNPRGWNGIGSAGGFELPYAAMVRLLLLRAGRLHARDGSVNGTRFHLTAVKNAFAESYRPAVFDVRNGIVHDCGFAGGVDP